MEYRNKTIQEMIFGKGNVVIDFCLMVFCVFFLGLMANIRIPLWPVPITMQTLGVFLIAFFFGSRKGVITIILYVLAGIMGFNVFAGYKSGIGAIFGPTGGYLIGFLAMAFFVGRMVEKGFGRSKKSVFLCMIAGELIMYFFGLIGLWYFLGGAGFLKVLSVGFFPFILGDILKISLAAFTFPYLWKIGRK